MLCSHAEKEYGRVLHNSGQHVEERCCSCKVKTRAGWVGKEELLSLGILHPDSLPVFRDLRTAAKPDDQPSLFGA